MHFKGTAENNRLRVGRYWQPQRMAINLSSKKNFPWAGKPTCIGFQIYPPPSASMIIKVVVAEEEEKAAAAAICIG